MAVSRKATGIPGVTTASKPTASAGGSDIIVTTIIELLGIGLLALIAGISDQIGKIMVLIMSGILLIWMMTNSGLLTHIVGKVGGGTGTNPGPAKGGVAAI